MSARPPNLGLSLGGEPARKKAEDETNVTTADIMAQIAGSIDDGISPGLSKLKLEPLAGATDLSLSALVRELEGPPMAAEVNPFQSAFTPGHVSLHTNPAPSLHLDPAPTLQFDAAPLLQLNAAPLPLDPLSNLGGIQVHPQQLPMLVVEEPTPFPVYEQTGMITRHLSMPSLVTDPLYPSGGNLSTSLNYYACASPDGFSSVASLSDNEYLTDASVEALSTLGFTVSQESLDSAAPSSPMSRRSSAASATDVKTEPRDPNAPPRRRRCTLKLSPGEKKARRMEQNRTAAARCRVKKQARMGNIVTETERLEQENAELQASLTNLEAQVAQLREELLSHQRVFHGGAASPTPPGHPRPSSN